MVFRRRIILISTAIVLVCAIDCAAIHAAAGSEAATLLPDKIIAEYAKTIEALSRVHLKTTMETFAKGGFFQNETHSGSVSAEFWRDGDRAKIIRQAWTTNVRKGEATEHKQEEEYLFNSSMIQVRFFPRQTSDGSGATVLARLVPEKHGTKEIFNFEQGEAILYGLLLGDGSTSLIDIFSSSDSRMSKSSEMLGDYTTILLRVKSKFGTHSLWLDPNIGFLPRKIESEKSGRDLLIDEPVESIQWAKEDGGRFPNSLLRAVVVTVDGIRTRKVGERDVIVGYERTRRYSFANGETHIYRDEFDASTFEVNPEFDDDVFQLSSKIADGTRVTVFDDRNIVYEWRDGEIRKVIDEETVQQFGKAGLAEPSAWGRVFFWTANVLLLVCVIAVLVWRHKWR